MPHYFIGYAKQQSTHSTTPASSGRNISGAGSGDLSDSDDSSYKVGDEKKGRMYLEPGSITKSIFNSASVNEITMKLDALKLDRIADQSLSNSKE